MTPAVLTSGRNAVILRSMLYAPASEPKKMRSALRAGADAVIFDLEDAVPAAGKRDARRLLVDVLTELPPHAGAAAPPAPWVFVRVNGMASLDADLDAAVRPGVAGLKVPKVEDGTALSVIAERMARLEDERGTGTLWLIPGIESALGMSQLERIARATSRTLLLSFGAADFAHDLHTDVSRDGLESLVPLSLIAVVSRAAGLAQPVDSVWGDLDDEHGLRASAHRARQLGYQGKAVIHPRQLGAVHEVFTTTAAQLTQAETLLRVAREQSARGSGAFVLDGRLVDDAHVRRAQAVVAASRRLREGADR